MQQNNLFSFARFGVLCKQNLIHNFRLTITSLIAFCGGLFILLLAIQIVNGFRSPDGERFFFGLFIAIFSITAIICTGTAFPNLRTKERTVSYLMLPASAFEKFLIEFLGRIVLFILIIPLVYWAVYNLEGYIVNLFLPVFSFEGQSLNLPENNLRTETASVRMGILTLTGGLLLLIIPFTGATVFVKNPLVKTLFAVAIIFFFNLFLVYFFLEIMKFQRYYPTTPILFVRQMEDGLLALIIGSMILNIGFLVAGYFKLKEREV